MFGKQLRQQVAALTEDLHLLTQARECVKEQMLYLDLDNSGSILSGNSKFSDELGIDLSKLTGHKIIELVPDYQRNTEHYHRMCKAISSHSAWVGAWQIVNPAGKEFWLRTTLGPMKTTTGKKSGFMLFATNLTRTIETSREYENLIAAMQRSMAVIEFDLNGHVLNANEIFLNAMGYRLADIKGKHHRMFCPADIHQSPKYQQFWDQLRAGHFIADRFKRIDSRGQEVWLEASYNPITNYRNDYYKVVKFATVITEQVRQEQEISATAQVAFETSSSTDASAKQGMQVMQETSNVMQQLAEQMTKAADSISDLDRQSQMISAIIQSISSIADQTNLLALNAAIEAARAGDQGRGFAVVADEVRQLASRTSDATKEIVDVVGQNRSLTSAAVSTIERSKKQADDVRELVNQASQAIAEIQQGAQKVVNVVSQFSHRVS